MTHPLAPVLVLAVGVVSLFLAGMGLRAWRRADDARLLFVTSAFGLFAVKNLLVAWGLWTEGIAHESLELLGAGFDLAVVLLLAAPFVLRRR